MTISVTRGFSIPGRISIESGGSATTGPDLKTLRVGVRFDPSLNAPAADIAPVSTDGSFSITNVLTGSYRLVITPQLQNAYIKSARLAESDILNPGLQLDRPPQGTLEIVIGTDPGTLDGMVLLEDRRPAPNVTVAIVPEAGIRQRTELYKSANTDGSGRFRLTNITPGNYKVFAWEDVEPNAWQNTEFLRDYEQLGLAVRIGEGANEPVTVQVIGARQ